MYAIENIKKENSDIIIQYFNTEDKLISRFSNEYIYTLYVDLENPEENKKFHHWIKDNMDKSCRTYADAFADLSTKTLPFLPIKRTTTNTIREVY